MTSRGVQLEAVRSRLGLGPDDVKVELVQIADQTVPAALQHVHFFGPHREEMQAWYVKVFGARASAPAPAARFLTATLPGVSLNFTASPVPVVGTRGRVVDHVGFEIDDLPIFLGKLDAMGIATEPVRQVPDSASPSRSSPTRGERSSN